MANSALFSGSKTYLFSGDQYIRVSRGEEGPGTVDPGYPKPISVWGWGQFGRFGIDAALHSGSKTYFFSGDQYIRVSRGEEGPGTVDPGYPKLISVWGWDGLGPASISPRQGFGELGDPAIASTIGIDAALHSGSKTYFFSGDQYIRVSRGEEGPGTVDPGYPKPISVWGWGQFGRFGIDAALHSGSKTYFFSGDQYIRVSRGEEGPGTVDPGYPKPISVWGWGQFGRQWSEVTANHYFDQGFSGEERRRVIERQTFAFDRIDSCASLNDAERRLIAEAYRRPIHYGREPIVNGRAWPNENWIFVNLGNFPETDIGNRELGQTLIHESAHVANFTHPMRTASDTPGDGGAYYGSVPLQAELCIGGVQSDEYCVEHEGSCAIGMP